MQGECHIQKDYADFPRHTNVPYYIQKKLKTIILIKLIWTVAILSQYVQLAFLTFLCVLNQSFLSHKLYFTSAAGWHAIS
jgi:hypothetical protein